MLTASVHLGLGKHAFAIDPSKITYAIKLYTIAVPLGIVVLALPTLAIAIVLNGLIAPSKWHTCILYFFPVLQFVVGITGIVMLFTQCTPTSALWNPQPGAKCRDKSITINYLYFLSGLFIQGHPHTHDIETIADVVYSVCRVCGCIPSCSAIGGLLETADQCEGEDWLVRRHERYRSVCYPCYRSVNFSPLTSADTLIGLRSVLSFVSPTLLHFTISETILVSLVVSKT